MTAQPYKTDLQWVVMIGAQCVVYPMQDGVALIECKPVLGGIEDATWFTNRRRATETALKTSICSGAQADAMLVRDAATRIARAASIINHETP